MAVFPVRVFITDLIESKIYPIGYTCILRLRSFKKTNGFAVVYHPQLVAVYHQHVVLYLIKPQGYAPSVMIYAYGDDMHDSVVMICQALRLG